MKEIKASSIQDLLAFYLHEKPDHAGRYVKDYLSFTDDYMEQSHDFIQWMFPVIGKSAFNLYAPNLTPETCEEFHRLILTNEIAKNTFSDFVCKFLNFLGIDFVKLIQTKEHVWYTCKNHNQLRISRFLNCLGYSRSHVYNDLARDLSYNLVTDQICNGIIENPQSFKLSKLFWALSPRFQFILQNDSGFSLELKYRNKTILDVIRFIQSATEIMDIKEDRSLNLYFRDESFIDRLTVNYINLTWCTDQNEALKSC